MDEARNTQPIEPMDNYFGQGDNRIELGATPGECYICYTGGKLEIRCKGEIVINGNVIRLN